MSSSPSNHKLIIVATKYYTAATATVMARMISSRLRFLSLPSSSLLSLSLWIVALVVISLYDASPPGCYDEEIKRGRQ
jgi:hypothetical protein